MSGRSKNRPGKDSVWLTNAWQGRISWRDCPLRVSYDNHQAGRPMLLPRSLTVAILALIAVLVSAQTQAAPAPSRINREQAVESIVPQHTPPAACHVTLPSDSTFVLPSSLSVGYGVMHGSQFYFGSEKLWTILPSSGVWGGTWRGPSREPFDSAYSHENRLVSLSPGVFLERYFHTHRKKAGRSGSSFHRNRARVGQRRDHWWHFAPGTRLLGDHGAL